MIERVSCFSSLAQVSAGPAEKDFTKAVWPLALLLFIVLVLFIIAGIVIYVVRSRAVKDDDASSDIPLTLSEIRRMRRDGEIDDDEMARLKGIVTAQTRGNLEKPPDVKKE